MLTDHFDT